jgi:hypothetical protein
MFVYFKQQSAAFPSTSGMIDPHLRINDLPLERGERKKRGGKKDEGIVTTNSEFHFPPLLPLPFI